MNFARFDTVFPAEPPRSLPFSVDLGTPGIARILLIGIALPLSAMALAPFGLLVADAPARTVLLARPESAIPLFLGFVTVATLAGLLLRRAAAGLGRSRKIEIADGDVTVTDIGPFRRRQWRESMTAFDGLAHHIRASVSGSRHELILVHPDRDRSLLLRVAPRISQSEIAATSALLGVPEVPARALYAARRRPSSVYPASSLAQQAT